MMKEIMVGDEFSLNHFNNLRVLVVEFHTDDNGHQQAVLVRTDNGEHFGRFEISNLWEQAVRVETRQVVYVNAYEVTECYGGPEEGGWWYDSGEALASVPMNADDEDGIEKMKEHLQKTIGWDKPNQLGRRSAAGGSDFEIYVEEEKGADFPSATPRYE